MHKETTDPTPEAPLGYNAFGEPRFYAKLTPEQFQAQAQQALSFVKGEPSKTQKYKAKKRAKQKAKQS